MLGRESRSQPFFRLFIQNGCDGRSNDNERQKPTKPGEGRGQTTFVVWLAGNYLVFSKGGREGGFCQGRKVSNWKGKAESWNDIKIISPPRAFVGRLWFFFFFFSEPLQLPYGRG